MEDIPWLQITELVIKINKLIIIKKNEQKINFYRINL